MRFISLKIIALVLLPMVVWGQSTNSQFEPLLKAAKKTNSNAVIVIQDGKKVVDYQKNQQKEKIYSRSVTKSIVALAVAKLLTENKLDSLDTPVAHFYPEWKQGLKKDITIRHLMNQTSGLQNVDRTNAEIYPAPNAIQLGLCASVVDTPGTKFNYNNKATNLLSGIVEKITDQKLDDYLGNSIFKPMDITDYNWQTDESGNPYAMSGFKVYPSDLAKLGQLVLQKGSWNNQQLISEKWVDEILAQGSPKTMEYGLLWWRIPKNVSYIIDDKTINRLKEAGLSSKMIAYAENMKGQYGSKGAVTDAIFSEFQKKSNFMAFRKATLGRNISMWRKSTSGPIIGYKAEGSLGEQMVIYPELDILAVRMVKRTKDYNMQTDVFGRFGNLVYELASTSDQQ